MTDDILREIARQRGHGAFLLPARRLCGKNYKYVRMGIFVHTNEIYKSVPCPKGCPEEAYVYRTAKGYFAQCNHQNGIENFPIDPEDVELLMFDEAAFQKSKLELPQEEDTSGGKVYHFIVSCDDATHTITMNVFNGKGKPVAFPFKIASDTCWSVVRQFADADSSPVVLKKPKGRKALNLKSMFRKTKGDNRDLFYKYIYTVKVGSRAAYELRQVPKK